MCKIVHIQQWVVMRREEGRGMNIHKHVVFDVVFHCSNFDLESTN